MQITNQLRKGTLKTILSILAGVIAGGLACIASAIVLFSLGFFIWADGGSKEEMQRMEMNMAISLLLMTCIGSIVAGLVTILISKEKSIDNAAICGTVLLLIYLAANNFSFAYFESFEAVSVLLILPFTIMGGWMAILYNKKKQSSL